MRRRAGNSPASTGVQCGWTRPQAALHSRGGCPAFCPAYKPPVITASEWPRRATPGVELTRRPCGSTEGGWTPVLKVEEDSFLDVERTTSLEAQRYNMAQGCRHVIRQRLKPWCRPRRPGTFLSSIGEIGRIANNVLNSLRFKTLWST